MADTYYAWSNLTTQDGETVKPGDTVSASSLGLSDEEFEQLVEAEAVRTTPWPEGMEDFAGSPMELAKRELAIAAGQIDAAEVEGVGVVPEKEKAPAPKDTK